MLRALIGLGTLLVVAGIVLLVAGSPVVGVILLLAGLVMTSILGAISTARRVYRSAREWASLAKGGGPQSVRIVSVQPPKGVFFNHDAVVTLEVTGDDGTTKRLDRDLPVAIPQAAMWKLAGRVPTPIGYLTEARDLNLAIWKKGWRGKRGATPEPGSQPIESANPEGQGRN